VYHITGQTIRKETVVAANGNQEHQIALLQNSASGNYFPKRNDGENGKIRFVVSEK